MPFYSLLKKEITRFSSIWVQTIIGPVSTALLYQLIFGTQLSSTATGIAGVSYSEFLIPGLVMMQILINAFGNSSSSLIQSKYSGNLIFILMAPISVYSTYFAYLAGTIVRGLCVGVAVYITIALFGHIHCYDFIAILYFAILGAMIAGGIGLIAGIVCEKFDQLSGFQSFLLTPLIYLSGIFFNVEHFSPMWKKIAMLDPFLYIIDGFKYGFFGYSSVNIQLCAIFVLVFALLVNSIGLILMKRGIKFKY